MTEPQDSNKEALQRKCVVLISLIASMLLISNLGPQISGGSAAFLNASPINTYSLYRSTVRQNNLNLTANTLDAIGATSQGVNDPLKQAVRNEAEAMFTKS